MECLHSKVTANKFSFQCALSQGLPRLKIHALPLSEVIAIFPLSETLALDQPLKVEL